MKLLDQKASLNFIWYTLPDCPRETSDMKTSLPVVSEANQKHVFWHRQKVKWSVDKEPERTWGWKIAGGLPRISEGQRTKCLKITYLFYNGLWASAMCGFCTIPRLHREHDCSLQGVCSLVGDRWTSGCWQWGWTRGRHHSVLLGGGIGGTGGHSVGKLPSDDL